MPRAAAAVLRQDAEFQNKKLAVLAREERRERKSDINASTPKEKIVAAVGGAVMCGLYRLAVFAAMKIFALFALCVREYVSVVVCAQLAPEARGFLSGDRFADRNLIFH